IDLNSKANANLRTYPNGTNYPFGGSQFTVAGVPFSLARLGGNSTTMGVVQGANPSGAAGAFSHTFAVPPGTHATVLYALVNTAWGQVFQNQGRIIVTGTGGETATLFLTEGFNLRDHDNRNFVNTLSDALVVPTYFLNGAPTTQSSQSRLDRQELLLPAPFVGDTIASITFEGLAQGNPGGSAFLAGLTLSTQLMPPSLLAIQRAGTKVILTWPTNSSAFTLQTATNLTPSVAWNPVAAAAAIIGGQNVVTSSIAGVPQFYALRGERTGADPGLNDTFGPVVQVSVQATNPLNGVLHYQWRATDGQIVNQDAPTTTWTMASGGGLHFAYVMISNGKGAYTQRRVAVITDLIGTPAIVTTPRAVQPPPSNPPQGNSVYAMVGDDGGGPFLPSVYLTDTNGNNPTATAAMDSRGFVTLFNVPAGDWVFPCGLYDGPLLVQTNCNGVGTADHKFTLTDNSFAGLGWSHFTATQNGPPAAAEIQSGVRLRDGSVPGVNNEFFGITSTAVGRLLTTNGLPSAYTMPARTSSGKAKFYFPAGLPAGLSEDTQFQIEGAQPVVAPIYESATNLDSTPPVVTVMTAVLSGTNVGIFLPPPAPVGPRHEDARAEDVFLTAKGIDSRLSAWKYYKAIAAITDYDAVNDRPIGGITFDDWKRHTGMDPYARNGKHDVAATYINRVDLNLTRVHHSISYGSNAVAAYVCNFLGPAADTQFEVDKAINNAVNGRNLVACVAMDHTVTPGVNGGRPFTRFLIFGPNGRLLPSINLDGEGEKFVPGSCVACHGGDHYAGSFPTTGTPSPDIGAHFLPYDTGNFSFSTNVGLSEAEQESAIHQLNINVLDAGPTPAVSELIAGWYQGGTGILDKNYVPPSYTGKSTNAIAFYKEFYAPSCRTCHVAMSEPGNFDHYDNLIQKTEPYHNYPGYDRIRFFIPQNPGEETFNSALMPNSLRTFSLLMAETNRLEIYWRLYYELDSQLNP
ncbi:MAG: hypothetical protein KBH45_19515, partial [Verrucomicrobia bacterium]|nr:hypothetical protein [Verrucomicrobiota bacterium]